MNTESDIDLYRRVIVIFRKSWLKVPTKTGRPSRGPVFFAVVQCTKCGDIGMTSSKHPLKGSWASQRWACPIDGEPRLPVWADGPTPDEDDIYEEWAKGQKE